MPVVDKIAADLYEWFTGAGNLILPVRKHRGERRVETGIEGG